MKIKIDIECETINEFLAHLDKIKIDSKKQIKKLKLNPIKDEFPKKVNLDDDNCYGEHTVKIKN
jgi:hypothetical protein